MQSEVAVTEKLRKWIVSSINQPHISDELKEELIPYSDYKTDIGENSDLKNKNSKIPFNLVRRMYNNLKKGDNCKTG